MAFDVDPSGGIGKANKARSRRPARNRPAMAAGLATLALFLAAHLLLPEEWSETFREAALDRILAIDHRLEPKVLDKAAANLIVVDIDRRSLAEIGAWPWPRERMADLVAVIASAKPAVVVFDMLFFDFIIARDAAGIPVFHGGLSPEGSPMRSTGRSPNGPSHMRRAIIRNGERFNVSVTELLPGPNGTVATCQELPELMVIGDDPDDALRRALKAIERRVGRAK